MTQLDSDLLFMTWDGWLEKTFVFFWILREGVFCFETCFSDFCRAALYKKLSTCKDTTQDAANTDSSLVLEACYCLPNMSNIIKIYKSIRCNSFYSFWHSNSPFHDHCLFTYKCGNWARSSEFHVTWLVTCLTWTVTSHPLNSCHSDQVTFLKLVHWLTPTAFIVK